MRIKKVKGDHILFDNGSLITYQHESDCCEFNYADFEQLEDEALDVEFNDRLHFETTKNSGFRFGNKGKRMFFVPCYSQQNGYYSSDVDILFNNIKVINIDCDVVD